MRGGLLQIQFRRFWRAHMRVPAGFRASAGLLLLAVIAIAGGSSAISVPQRIHGLRACGALDRPGSSYALLQDVSSTGTCFSIEAENVSLDLAGHTITYATEPQGLARFGISGIACWDPDLRPHGIAERNPCAEDSGHFTVFNGTITQASGAAPFSHGIRIGQTRNGDYLTVHDVTFNVAARSSIPVYTTFTGAGSTIYNNTFNNQVETIDNRHQEQGQSIKFNNTKNITPGQRIYGNVVIGGAQGGILTESPESIIRDNSIAQNGRYTNDFAVNLWGKDQIAYGNHIIVSSGRGIFIDGIVGAVTNVSAHDNDIEVIERRQNQEYGGCELGGAYGIQFDDHGSGRVSHNRVLAKADQCDAKGLRLTRVGPGSSSEGNTYSAQRIGGTSSVAAAFSTGGGAEFISSGDKFVADTYNVDLDWDGGRDLVFDKDTFIKGENPAHNYATLSFRNSVKNAVAGIRLIDCVFLNGASKDSTNMQQISSGNWPGADEYFIDWTLTLFTARNEGPLGGATVTIIDALGRKVFEGTTDAQGRLATVLTEFRRFNTPDGVTKEMHTPHSITIKHEGCSPTSQSAEIHSVTELRVTLECPDPKRPKSIVF